MPSGRSFIERLRVDSHGDVWLALRHRWGDGTTHLKFDPLELFERLERINQGRVG